jgi:hypothetical protein
MKFNKQFDLFNFSFCIIKNEKDFYVDFLYKSYTIFMTLVDFKPFYMDLTAFNGPKFILLTFQISKNYTKLDFLNHNIIHKTAKHLKLFGTSLFNISYTVNNIKTKHYFSITIYDALDCIILFPIFIYYMITIKEK